LDRTNFPVGLDDNELYSLNIKEPLIPEAIPMFKAIKKMTDDLSDINMPPIP
jgi:hypothetical protein